MPPADDTHEHPKPPFVPHTEEQILAVRVGGSPPSTGPVIIADYDPAWPRLFAREAKRIRAALGDQIVLLEHVGSTSVPGLAAKPRIDILLIVPNSADEPAYVAPLEAAGYTLRIREPDWHEHRLLNGPDTDVNLPRLLARQPGDRPHAALPRLAPRPRRRPRPLRAHQARTRQPRMAVRPELRRRQDRGRRRDPRPRPARTNLMDDKRAAPQRVTCATPMITISAATMTTTTAIGSIGPRDPP